MASKSNGQMDRGWAWLVLLGACFLTAFSDGFRNCSGIFYSEFIDTMNLSQSQSASVVGLLSAMFFLPGPIAAWLAQRIGTRWTINLGALFTATGLIISAFVTTYWALLVSFGFMTGLGMGISFVPAMGGFHKWFSRYHQLAFAVCMTFGAVGIFSLAPLLNMMVNEYTWKGAAIISAAIALNCTISSGMLYLTKTPNQGPTKPLANRKSDNRALFTNPAFIFHLLNAFFMFGFNLFLIFIVRHVTHYRGFTHEEAAVLVSIYGIASVAGRLSIIALTFIPFLATKNVRFLLFNGSSLFGAIACGALPVVWQYSAVAAACAVVGLMQGLKVGSMLSVTMDITTPKRFQTGYGYFSFASGLSVISIPPLAGYLAETFRSYDPVYYLSAAALALTFLLGSLSQFLDNKESRRLHDTPERNNKA